jgi:hypothetical protein
MRQVEFAAVASARRRRTLAHGASDKSAFVDPYDFAQLDAMRTGLTLFPEQSPWVFGWLAMDGTELT